MLATYEEHRSTNYGLEFDFKLRLYLGAVRGDAGDILLANVTIAAATTLRYD